MALQQEARGVRHVARRYFAAYADLTGPVRADLSLSRQVVLLLARMWLRFACVVVVCTLSGCKGKTGGTPPIASASASMQALALSPPSASSATQAPASVSFDSASARQLVERWVRAQNDHDFTAYSALYAPRFSGTKRVGGYSKRFDRASW